MTVGLVEINPGLVAWYKLSSVSTKLEPIGSKKFKINKNLNFSSSTRTIATIVSIIDIACDELKAFRCSEVWILASGNFPPMYIANIKEDLPIKYISDSIWKFIASDYLVPGKLNIWFERTYIKIGWIERQKYIVETLFSKYPNEVLLNGDLYKTVAKELLLHELPRNIEHIEIGGNINLQNRLVVSSVIIVVARLFQYATIDYNLPPLMEMYGKRIIKGKF